VVDAGEVALQGREKLALGAALEDLGEEMSARLQYLKREIGGDLAEVNRAEVVGLARTLLIGERTALNFLQRMSGVATPDIR